MEEQKEIRFRVSVIKSLSYDNFSAIVEAVRKLGWEAEVTDNGFVNFYEVKKDGS
jgi:hypothetical protein